jgi:hypothetical protein
MVTNDGVGAIQDDRVNLAFKANLTHVFIFVVTLR